MFFWNSLAFLMIQQILAIWSLIPLPFLKPAWTSGSSQFMYYWSLASFQSQRKAMPKNAQLLQVCPTLCDPTDCSPPDSSVCEIFQVRTLEWVGFSYSRGSSWPRDWARVFVSCIGRWDLYHEHHLGSPIISLYISNHHAIHLKLIQWLC